MRCVRDAELRTRCKMLTWQELAEVLPERSALFSARNTGSALQLLRRKMTENVSSAPRKVRLTPS